MIDELSKINCEILVVDKSKEIIEMIKDRVTNAVIADAINEETINKLIPKTIDAAVVDLGDRIEVSILVTNYLKKMGIKNIVAKAESNEHGEILEIIGADHVVFPNREAAKRLAPMILSELLHNYLPINDELVIAEIQIPEKYNGKSLREADLRKSMGINVIGVKQDAVYKQNFDPDYIIQDEEIMLVAGSPSNISSLSGEPIPGGEGKKKNGFFSRF